MTTVTIDPTFIHDCGEFWTSRHVDVKDIPDVIADYLEALAERLEATAVKSCEVSDSLEDHAAWLLRGEVAELRGELE